MVVVRWEVLCRSGDVVVCCVELLEVILRGGGDAVTVVVMCGGGFLRLFLSMFPWLL